MATFLGEWLGLDGLFWMIAILSAVSLVLVLTSVPNQETTQLLPEHASFWSMFKIVWKVPSLRTISWGGFVCGVGLSSSFFLIPMILVQHGFERAEMWKIYLPMMLAGAVTMVLAAIFAEVRNRFREVMLFGIVLLLLSLVFMGFGQEQGRVVLYICLLYTSPSPRDRG